MNELKDKIREAIYDNSISDYAISQNAMDLDKFDSELENLVDILWHLISDND